MANHILFRNKDFALSFLSMLFSNLGDSIYMIFISWYIADVYQSASLMGIVLLCTGVIRFLLGLVGGAFVDQIGARKVMYGSDALRALLMIASWWLLGTGRISAPLLLGIAILFGMVDSFYWPASGALQQRIVEEKDYSKANGLAFTVARATNLFGPVLGGYVITYLSYKNTMILITGCFLISAVSLFFIRVMKPIHLNDSSDAVVPRLRQYVGNVREGSKFLLANKTLMILIVTMFFANVGANGIGSVMPFLAQQLHLGAAGFGMLRMASAVGSLVAGVIFSIWSIQKPSVFKVQIGFLGQGLFFGAIYWLNQADTIALSLALVGMFTALIGVCVPTILQQNVPQNSMGQIGGIMMTVTMASTPFSQFVLVNMSAWTGTHAMFSLAGAIEVLTAVVAMICLGFRRREAIKKKKEMFS